MKAKLCTYCKHAYLTPCNGKDGACANYQSVLALSTGKGKTHHIGQPSPPLKKRK